jgi:hypothetical protein
MKNVESKVGCSLGEFKEKKSMSNKNDQGMVVKVGFLILQKNLT